jgi:hypothetical protein
MEPLLKIIGRGAGLLAAFIVAPLCVSGQSLAPGGLPHSPSVRSLAPGAAPIAIAPRRAGVVVPLTEVVISLAPSTAVPLVAAEQSILLAQPAPYVIAPGLSATAAVHQLTVFRARETPYLWNLPAVGAARPLVPGSGHAVLPAPVPGSATAPPSPGQ